ncbi:antibiotic biosynthesis monooxygenase [Jannaschia pagri]|uniref:Antibiotic biosynthesis monooxygenase n=1 Tax=Jannaschia pagri TaxID=2829797 RepID=A0ABQ4NG60_9RHOB|nr:MULTISPECIES: putative quinol monooxygenase [unclassified Jannaschia]GIT90477.1 antibiotic biosynthesis monooxygenase [Jannaschia sp. AI_61]GIT93418.1 antibiotic biosynthesis monooxygenase [Jannaschia sp. AI_62]
MTDLNIFARITPKPEFRSAAIDAVRGIIPATTAEPGCLRFELNVGTGEDPAIYLVERWTDEAALAAHYAMPYTAAVMENYADWLAEPAEIIHMHPA